MHSFDSMWDALLPVGRHGGTGGYRRFAYNAAELECREWFIGAAAALGLNVQHDRNGNLWAWWNPTGAEGKAVVIGSHLDSVPDGGAFDGPLGVVSSLAAVQALQHKGFSPARPVGIACFADEEGARFGIACAGSRLLTGQLAPDKARALVGRDGATMAEAMRSAGVEPEHIGRDDEMLARIGTYVELHVEQGRYLIDTDAPVGVATAIWPHGRYRYTFCGTADHAGATRMQDRHDPMLSYAHTAIAAEAAARRLDSRATFGRMEVEPNGTNAIPSVVRAWLDARAADEAGLQELLAEVRAAANADAGPRGISVDIVAESELPVVEFDVPLRERVRASVARQRGVAEVPILPTGAGHDAGILAGAGIPSAMLFVRNPTGISHSPDEFAERTDCHAGVEALVAVVEDLAS